jgi:DNA invertase Pin-like site-specific DNA recombinase
VTSVALLQKELGLDVGMITDALAGKFDALVVHKLDRFSRNLRITLEYFDKLSKAGGDFPLHE